MHKSVYKKEDEGVPSQRCGVVMLTSSVTPLAANERIRLEIDQKKALGLV